MIPALAVSLAACEPDNKVKPGAPVLMSLSIIEASGTRTDVTPETADCAANTAEGGDCDPSGSPCRLTTTFCHCAAKAEGDCTVVDGSADTGGSWVCHYGPQAQVLAVFDRLLDTAPFTPGGSTDVATFASTGTTPSMAVSASTDYNPDGSPVGLIFPAFGHPPGPSLLLSADPAMPAAANVAFALPPAKVRAKDGHTAYTGDGLLQGGSIAFDTLPFGAGIAVPVAPPPPPMDAGTPDDGGADGGMPVDADVVADAAADMSTMPDAGSMTCTPPAAPTPLDVPPSMDPVTITFNNPVDAATIAGHITVTSNGTAVPAADIKVDTGMDPTTTTVTITPTAKWPASATIVVTVDADAADILGSKLGAAATGSFTTTSGT